MNIALIGLGNVGQGLLRILIDKRDELKQRYGFTPRVVAVATGTRGTLFLPNGLTLERILGALEKGGLQHYPDSSSLRRDWDAMRLLQETNADVLVEASPTNLQTGQPALDLCRTALETGKHVVLANKGPVALAYPELMEKAKSAGKKLLFEGTVMAGTPSLRLAQSALAGCTINAVRGIINGTTNYILTEMETGLSYGEALAQAQSLGYAETDPSGDVDGWDAAGKARILAAALFGKVIGFDEMQVSGITGITPDNMRLAQQEGERWKLIATVTPEGASVAPMRLPLSHPLANVNGATNAITYSTDLLGDVTLIGPGAGRVQTGFALLSDLLDIHQTAAG
ncbi:MAG: homoserine dehydrogenase [bacterium]|nr:homoserine dehydrogenase [bacterium]